jgi:DNA-binding FrmR family transcriptional regulator
VRRCEVHEHKETRRIANRLSRIEGHVRAVRTMVEEQRPCADVLIQIAAIRSALDRAAKVLLADHFETCLAAGVARSQREKALADLRLALDRYIS